ncbi:thiamine phosphate synthase [Echinicola arenosa]|nr:thiamine phosphate synthase [Echinicola arenosa]
MMYNKNISQFQYITPNLNHPDDFLYDIEKKCDLGVKWIQLRMKDFPKSIILKTAFLAKVICEKYDCTLIINDHPEIAKKSGAAGVHVGKEDQQVLDIRERFGSELLIGATANTLEDILAVKDQVDYIGLGPFQFTSTKKKLSPILGLEGYQFILEQLRFHNIDIPIIGIGGIKANDLVDLRSCGLYGVAVSGLINDSKEPEEIIQKINKTFDYADYSR